MPDTREAWDSLMLDTSVASKRQLYALKKGSMEQLDAWHKGSKRQLDD